MALLRLLRRGIVQQTTEGTFRLHSALFEAGYSPSPDPYKTS
jgi:hypothetical protein